MGQPRALVVRHLDVEGPYDIAAALRGCGVEVVDGPPDTLDGFGTTMLGAAPALLGIALIVFGVPFVWRWAKRLIS